MGGDRQEGMAQVTPAPETHVSGFDPLRRGCRVGIFNPVPLEFLGGGEAFEITLGNFLGREGYSVELVSDANSRATHRVTTQSIQSQLQVSYSRIPFERTVTTNRFPVAPHPLPPVDVLDRFDISLVMVYRVPPASYLIKLRRTKVPIVFMVHGISFEDSAPPYPLIRLYLWYNRLGTRVWARLIGAVNAYFQVLNPVAERQLVGLGIRPTRVTRIPNCIDFDRYSIGSETGRFNVVFMSRLDDVQKGTGLLVSVIEWCLHNLGTGVSFDIVGGGRKEMELRLTLKACPNVTVHGFVSDSEKRAILADSSLGLVTSSMETFSMTTLEFLASGLPVITTPAAGPRSLVVSNPEFGTVVPFRPDLIGQTIGRAWSSWRSSPISYALRRNRIRALAAEYFRPETSLTLYRNLVDTLTRC